MELLLTGTLYERKGGGGGGGGERERNMSQRRERKKLIGLFEAHTHRP